MLEININIIININTIINCVVINTGINWNNVIAFEILVKSVTYEIDKKIIYFHINIKFDAILLWR